MQKKKLPVKLSVLFTPAGADDDDDNDNDYPP